MAPPSRASLALRAAKKLEEASEAIFELTPSVSGVIVAERLNMVYQSLTDVTGTLVALKDMCDLGANTYPNYPAVREAMLEAGNAVYWCKQEIESLKREALSTPSTDLMAWRDLGVTIADIASRLRAIQFVAKRRKPKQESSSAPTSEE